MASFEPPASGTPLKMGDDGKLVVPSNPIIPFIEGDGIGRDIWKASVRVFDAAVEKAYGGDRKISEACARLRIQLAIVRATSMCIRSHSHDNNTYGAVVNRTEGEEVPEEEIEEEGEEPLDLAGEWYDLRTGMGA